MSGGSYNYVSYQFQEAASGLRSRHAKQSHVMALAKHLDEIAQVMHDIEWADSGDTSWGEKLDSAIRAVLPKGKELRVAKEALDEAILSLDAAVKRAQEVAL